MAAALYRAALCFIVLGVVFYAHRSTADEGWPAGLIANLREVNAGQNSPQSVALEFRLLNPTDDIITVLSWYTPIEGVMNNIFEVVDESGATLPYRGMMAKRGDPSRDALISLRPGQSYTNVVDLASAYAFERGHKYEVKFSHYVSLANGPLEAVAVDGLEMVMLQSNDVTVVL